MIKDPLMVTVLGFITIAVFGLVYSRIEAWLDARRAAKTEALK